MNIVFLFDSTYPYYTGGIETWIYNVCERMCENHNITIFNVKNYRKDNLMGTFEKINEKIEFVSVENLCHKRFISRFIRSYLSVYNSNVTAKKMAKTFCEWKKPGEKYYIISLGTLFAAKAARIIKNKYPDVISIVSSRSLHPEVLGEKYPGLLHLALRLERKNLKVANDVWANGEDTKEALNRKNFNCRVIRNGIDIEYLDSIEPYNFSKMGLENKIVITTIGTVQKIKGYYELIEAISILKNKYNLEVHMVGVGKGNAEKFIHFAQKLGVISQIHFVGEQRNAIAYAKSADLVACLSGGSGYGMASLESMLSKTPVIAWNHPGYQQLIREGENGYLVEPWNALELANKIFLVYSMRNEEKRNVCNKAYISVKKFDWSYVISDIEEALHDCEKRRSMI